MREYDIIGNAMHVDAPPAPDRLVDGLVQLSRRDLLAQQKNSPMLAINGVDDYVAPKSDTLVFEGRPCDQVDQAFSTAEPLVSRYPAAAKYGPEAIL
jgi:esterase FrsA